MSDLNKDIDEVLKNLKLAKKSLSNVYLNLIDENDDDFFVNLDTGEKVQNLKHDNCLLYTSPRPRDS